MRQADICTNMCHLCAKGFFIQSLNKAVIDKYTMLTKLLKFQIFTKNRNFESIIGTF